MDRFFVVTGSPGAGKTTLVAALAAEGFACTREAGRALIRAAAEAGRAPPWSDPAAYAADMLDHEMSSYEAALGMDGPVLFDRGVPDIAGYARLTGVPPPQGLHEAALALRYNPVVFLAPPWPAIYRQDQERLQTFAEAEATCRLMAEAYAEYGYSLVPLPLVDVPARAAFVRQVIATS